MVAVLADATLYRHTGGQPPTYEDLVRRYSSQVAGHSPDGTQKWINLVVVLNGEPIGYVQATIPVDGDSAEIAWVIGRPWQGHGYAKRATALLVADLVGRDIHRVMAHIHPDHVVSQRVALHLGMVASDDIVDGEMRWVGDVG